jgi:hypothetical protein
MPGLPDTQPAPDLPDEQRLALVVATESYDDASLRRLRAPGHDAEDLRGVLADPDVGGFSVSSVTDGTAQEVRIAVADFLADRRPDDLVLVYLSCHGLVDLRRRLYFAARDTTKERLAATGVESQWLLEQLEDCRAKRQVLILDCCFSGAFALRSKGDDDLGIGERFHGQGRGRVVLTASRDSEYSFEGEPVPGQAVPGSVFTGALVDGIRSGAADLDRDGYVSVDDAYGYAFDTVRASNAEQTPQRWFYGAEGSILLARNPAGVTITPAEVPDGIVSSLDSSYPSVRIGAVEAIAEWLRDDDPARRLAARQTLARVAEHDRPEVAARAQALLDAAEDGRPVAAGSGSDGGATGSDWGRAGAPGPDRPSRGRPWLTRRRGVYGLGALLAVVVAVGGIALLTRDSPGAASQDQGQGGEPSLSSWATSEGGKERTITAAAPWRLTVNGQNAGGDGCNYSVTDTETGDQVLSPATIYGVRSAQIHMVGTLRLQLDDAGCLAQVQDGVGDRALPFPSRAGDTDAFRPSGSVTVRVTDFSGNSDCQLVMYEADTGIEVAFASVTPRRPAADLDPGNADLVYVSSSYCAMNLSDASS